MATLAGLRTLAYTYLSTTAADPAYPAATMTALLNAVANRYIDDIHQQKPDYLSSTTTLSTSVGSRTYTLPANFAGWLEVRLTDADGAVLPERRAEELGDAAWAFAVTGPDGTAVLTTGTGVTAAAGLFLRYRTVPAELVADADTPSWMPARFHDLLAREAAIDAFGLGNESTPASHFITTTADRKHQFWYAIGRRGVSPMTQR